MLVDALRLLELGITHFLFKTDLNVPNITCIRSKEL